MARWVYFEFIEMSKSGKTEVYMVRAKRGNIMLGTVKWDPPWRQYAFFPFGDRVFEPDCLRDIAAFLDSLMAKRKPFPEAVDDMAPRGPIVTATAGVVENG